MNERRYPYEAQSYSRSEPARGSSADDLYRFAEQSAPAPDLTANAEEAANPASEFEYWDNDFGSDGIQVVGWNVSGSSVTIPSEIDGRAVTIIGQFAFQDNASLTEIDIPDSVIMIKSYAFKGCSGLKEILLPDGISSISGDAFSGCTSLAAITLPQKLNSLGSTAFKECTDGICHSAGGHGADAAFV